MEKDAKRRLGRYKKLMEMVKELNKQAEELGNRAEAIGSKRITDMPRGGKHVTTEDLIVEKADIEKRRDNFLKKALDEKQIVQQYIDTVESPKHNRLLCGIYLEDLSVNEIAEKEGYSIRQEWRIYKEAHEMVNISECQNNVSTIAVGRQ